MLLTPRTDRNVPLSSAARWTLNEMPNLIVFRPKSAAYDPIYTSNIDHNIPVGGHACCASHYRFFAVGSKPIIFDFLEQKINLSGISPAKRSRSGENSVYVDRSRGDNVQGILGAIGPFWAKWALGRVPRSPRFFCLVNHATFRELRNGRFSPTLVMKRSSVSRL